MRDTIVTILVGLTMLLGLIGIVIPILPDLLLIWGAALVYGLVVGWGTIGPWMFAVITLLGILGGLAEGWVTGVGARKGGASLWSVVGGFALSLVGLVVLGPLGFLIGLLLGIFLLELFRHRNVKHAARATTGTGLGYGASFVVKFIFGLGMIAAWLVWVFAG